MSVCLSVRTQFFQLFSSIERLSKGKIQNYVIHFNYTYKCKSNSKESLVTFYGYFRPFLEYMKYDEEKVNKRKVNTCGLMGLLLYVPYPYINT